MRRFFSFNCPFRCLQCTWSKDAAGRARWSFHSRPQLVSSTKLHLKNCLHKKAADLSDFSHAKSPFRPRTPPSLGLHFAARTDLEVWVPRPLMLAASSPAEWKPPSGQFTSAKAKGGLGTWKREKAKRSLQVRVSNSFGVFLSNTWIKMTSLGL